MGGPRLLRRRSDAPVQAASASALSSCWRGRAECVKRHPFGSFGCASLGAEAPSEIRMWKSRIGSRLTVSCESPLVVTGQGELRKISEH